MSQGGLGKIPGFDPFYVFGTVGILVIVVSICLAMAGVISW